MNLNGTLAAFPRRWSLDFLKCRLASVEQQARWRSSYPRTQRRSKAIAGAFARGARREATAECVDQLKKPANFRNNTEFFINSVWTNSVAVFLVTFGHRRWFPHPWRRVTTGDYPTDVIAVGAAISPIAALILRVTRLSSEFRAFAAGQRTNICFFRGAAHIVVEIAAVV